ncbi:thymidylate kinase [Campylobacterota bacterium]|nr:thymidylate kinase [Campylobacterota bacterium]
MYIAIEGIDYTGKSTQIEALKQHFPDAIFTQEPGATPLGEQLRELALHTKMHNLARSFIFLADRAEHIAQVVAPSRAEKMIISDRSLISGVAYAGDLAEMAQLVAVNRMAAHGVLPDLAVILKIDDTNTLLRRMANQKPDEIEKEGLDYLLKVQEGLIAAAEALGIPFETIDAALPQSDITEKIKELIDDYSA